MPAPKTKKRSRAAPKTHTKAETDPAKMSDSQRVIFRKLRRQGKSERAAAALSHHAAKRKDSAKARSPHKRAASKASPIKKSPTSKRGKR